KTSRHRPAKVSARRFLLSGVVCGVALCLCTGPATISPVGACGVGLHVRPHPARRRASTTAMPATTSCHHLVLPFELGQASFKFGNTSCTLCHLGVPLERHDSCVGAAS